MYDDRNFSVRQDLSGHESTHVDDSVRIEHPTWQEHSEPSDDTDSIRGSVQTYDDHGISVLQDILQKTLQRWWPTEEDNQVMDDCLTSLRELVGANLARDGKWCVEAFGSAGNGYGTRYSDMDVVAYESVSGQTSSAVSVLRKLAPIFENSESFSVIDEVLGARVPILKLRFAGRLRQLDVDLSVNNYDALLNSQLLRQYSSIDARVRQLGVAVKLWAKDRKVHGAPSNFLSSYALILMTIYFLQVTAKLPCLQSNERDWGWQLEKSFASLFKEFLDFYAHRFEWGYEVVSVRIGSRKHADSAEFLQLRNRENTRLHIEDPYIRSRNLCDVMSEEAEDRFREAIKNTDQALTTGYNGGAQQFPVAGCTLDEKAGHDSDGPEVIPLPKSLMKRKERTVKYFEEKYKGQITKTREKTQLIQHGAEHDEVERGPDTSDSTPTCSPPGPREFSATIENLNRIRANLEMASNYAVKLKKDGHSAAQLKELGYSALQLKKIGYTTSQLKAALYSTVELKVAGCSAAQLKKLGCSDSELSCWFGVKQAGPLAALVGSNGRHTFSFCADSDGGEQHMSPSDPHLIKLSDQVADQIVKPNWPTI